MMVLNILYIHYFVIFFDANFGDMNVLWVSRSNVLTAVNSPAIATCMVKRNICHDSNPFLILFVWCNHTIASRWSLATTPLATHYSTSTIRCSAKYTQTYTSRPFFLQTYTSRILAENLAAAMRHVPRTSHRTKSCSEATRECDCERRAFAGRGA